MAVHLKQELPARRRSLRPERLKRSLPPAAQPLSTEPELQAFQQNSASYFERLFVNSPCAAVVLDSLGRLQDCNEAFRELVGTRRWGAWSCSFSIYVAQASLIDFLRHLRECLRSPDPVKAAVSLRGRGGKIVPVLLFSVYDRSPGREQYRIVIVDDTDRQLAVEKARSEHEAYHELIDSLDAIVWEMDAESGQTTFLSKKAGRLFGSSAGDWNRGIHYRWRPLHVDDRERVLNEVARAVASGKNFTTEYRTFTNDRKLIWLQDSVTVLRVDGRLRLRGVAVDITERKAAETRSVQATEDLERRVEQRTAELKWTISELESFSYTLSHDMRAPLRSIRSYAELLAGAETSKDSVDAQDYLNRIMRSAERLDALVQDVLKYSGMAKQANKHKRLDLNALVPAIASEISGFKAKGARIDVAKKLAPVMGHEGFLSQCLFNLLANAAKFVEPGKPPRVRIWTEMRDDYVQIFVADNGIGIAPADHVRIFKMFERCHRQRKIEGSGLGLAIVQRAAERMGGSVGVESALGKGSKFWIQLRRAYEL